MTPIFYYHSVGGEPPQTLHKERFREHLELIARHGFTTLTVREALLKRQQLPKKSCVLAFDDGLLDNFTVALPLLQEFGLRATFYVVPGYDKVTRWVNPANGRWSDVPLQGYTIPFASMGREHRAELLKAGMEVGSHTLSHPKLTKIAPALWESEIRGSKDALEQELGCPMDTFCYPNGRFNLAITKIVRKAGYLGACSTLPGYLTRRSPRFILPRFLVEDPVCFEGVLLGRAHHPRTWMGPLRRRLRGALAT